MVGILSGYSGGSYGIAQNHLGRIQMAQKTGWIRPKRFLWSPSRAVSENSKSLHSLIFGLFESDEDGIACDEDGALDEHAVGGEQVQHFLVGHGFQFVLQAHLPVEHAGGVEEFLHGQTALFLPIGELLCSGILFLDVAQFIGNVVVFEPGLRLAAGRAFGIADEKHGDSSVWIWAVVKHQTPTA